MGVCQTTASYLIKGALRDLNVLEAGEPLDSQSGEDGLDAMLDMLASWRTEKLYCFSSTEQRFIFQPGKYQYTIGNPIVGTFAGTVTGSSNQITGVTVPTGLVQGSMLTDDPSYGGQGALPVGIQAVQVTGIVGSTLTMNQNALLTPANNPEQIAYSTPGDIAYDSTTGAAIELPVRITNAFTRITVSGGNPFTQALDYQMRIIPRDKYTALGLKGIAGPWPTDVYYDRTYPLGNLYFYPNPSMGGECHLWVDTPLEALRSLTAPIVFPDEYRRAIRKNLALELAPEYGKTPTATLVKQAQQAKAAVKALNAVPGVEAFFDQHILRSRRADAGWVLHGGFYS